MHCWIGCVRARDCLVALQCRPADRKLLLAVLVMLDFSCR